MIDAMVGDEKFTMLVEQIAEKIGLLCEGLNGVAGGTHWYVLMALKAPAEGVGQVRIVSNAPTHNTLVAWLREGAEKVQLDQPPAGMA
jgi:hypothetical protein